MTRKAREGGASAAVLFYLLLIMAFVGVSRCHAGDVPINPKTIPLASEYDLDSSSYIYCYTLGKDGNVRGDWLPGNGFIKTSGSSTTTVSNTTSGAALNGISVGDELMIVVSGRFVRRYVTAAASVDSITVNSAWDLSSGTGYYVRHRTCSTAATAGWFRVSELNSFSVEFKIQQMDAASIDVLIQCRADDASGATNDVFTRNYTGTGGDVYVAPSELGQLGDECRFGMRVNTDDGADTTTHAEKISVNLMTR